MSVKGHWEDVSLSLCLILAFKTSMLWEMHTSGSLLIIKTPVALEEEAEERLPMTAQGHWRPANPSL